MRISDWSSDVCSSDLPCFLRRSIEASDVWSSMRVAPRSVIVVIAVSAMMVCGSAAVEATGQVQEISPTVRKRTVIVSGISRSEEHTSELQSLMRISYAVFCLKKKNKHITNKQTT